MSLPHIRIRRFCHVFPRVRECRVKSSGQFRLCSHGGKSADGSRQSLKWVPIPASVGLAFIGLTHFRKSQNRLYAQDHPDELVVDSLLVQMYRMLPARVLSRAWGYVNDLTLPIWLRQPVLGLYVWLFSCNMSEAEKGSDLTCYANLSQLFTRQLKKGARPVDQKHSLVSPCDGRVLHFGPVNERGFVEQVKGVSYPLKTFFGHGLLPAHLVRPSSDQALTNSKKKGETRLLHCILYLAPGDYHHFHSPADWTVAHRRHFPGDLLSVSPFIMKCVRGALALNERVLLTGHWKHGFFSFSAVGAYNVGSIHLTLDPDLKTNTSGGELSDKFWHAQPSLQKGDELGGFQLGSSIVLVFEAPASFQFTISAGDPVKCGQPLGDVRTSR